MQLFLFSNAASFTMLNIVENTYSNIFHFVDLICPQPPATGLEPEDTCNNDGDCAPGQLCCQATLERNTRTCKRALSQGK